MSELPRVEFNDDGLSMSIDQAVDRFRSEIERIAEKLPEWGVTEHSVVAVVRPCDCSETLDGLDEYCPLHGDKA